MDDITEIYSRYLPPPPPGGVLPAAMVHLPYLYRRTSPPPLSSPPRDHYSLLYASHGSHDEVRTLFVAGFPEDVKPREIYNLFREFPGYESSQLRNKDGDSKPFAFAVFSDQQSAIAAKQALNGMVFDLEKLSVLHIDLAKSNSRSKRSRTDDDQHSSTKAKASRNTLGSAVLKSGQGLCLDAFLRLFLDASRLLSISLGNTDAARNSNKSSAAPCPTLFVANLSPNCTENELTRAFSRCRGFLKLKVQSTYGSPVAFVDFQDVDSSTEALIAFQGLTLQTSATGICEISDGIAEEGKAVMIHE